MYLIYCYSPSQDYLYSYIYDDRSNFTRLKCIGTQVEDYITQTCIEYHQDTDHARINNSRRSVPLIIHTLLGVAVFWKVQV